MRMGLVVMAWAGRRQLLLVAEIPSVRQPVVCPFLRRRRWPAIVCRFLPSANEGNEIILSVGRRRRLCAFFLRLSVLHRP